MNLLVLGALLFNLSTTYAATTQFAIYSPGVQGDGVWKEEVKYLEKMMDLLGLSYKKVDAEFINEGRLGLGKRKNFEALIMPGGTSLPRTKQITLEGKKAIELFVKSGGGYLGFCAGSYYATETITWAEVEQDYEDFDYPQALNLFHGIAQGPFGWAPWNHGTVMQGLETVELNTKLPTLKSIDAPAYTELFYFGGPFFKISNRDRENPDLEIWGRAIPPHLNRRASQAGAKQPTIIHFPKGKGEVILFSYHPVILLGGSILGHEMPVFAPHRKIVRRDPSPLSLDQVNYDSWNLLNAAFQVVRHQPVKRLSVSLKSEQKHDRLRTLH